MEMSHFFFKGVGKNDTSRPQNKSYSFTSVCISSYFSLFWLSSLKNCVALCAGMCVCVHVQTRLDANHPWMKCILCLRAYYLDNNIHISSHLQSFITALWALSLTLSRYLSLSFSLAHTLIHTHTYTHTAERDNGIVALGFFWQNCK